MLDWAPVVVGVALFVLLSPGLLIELPGTHGGVDFGSLRVTGQGRHHPHPRLLTLFAIITMACNHPHLRIVVSLTPAQSAAAAW
ncbi:hypothetical protein HU200_053124 [Digitaria exilis]|uniref:Uncharacterized protein n=1 Tax=Digitaria exilis TaxID=1010633 RepID=A0A835AHX3_9POAL|nr:hypothetical protein HU200_053124 [Digitaria exilis]